MLKNTPVKDIDVNEKRKRKAIFIAIGAICAIAIILAIIIQVVKPANTEEKTEEKPQIEVKDFNLIFDNKLNTQGFEITQINKEDVDEDIVYTTYEFAEKADGIYDIDIKLPALNIDNEESERINKEILDIFKVKAQSIMADEESKSIIYTVEYTAYINSNILSLVIKSNLKEGHNAQRVIVKSYTYNISSGELIGIDEMISIEELDKKEMRDTIDKVVAENAKQNENLNNLGYKVYERDLSSEMYNIENINNFFYGPDGVVYIIFAYGNNNFTAELDVIPIQ